MSVLSVSSNWSEAVETHATMTVRQPPPRLSLSRRVSRESRKGTCSWSRSGRRELSASAWMQLASARSDWLILAPSLRRFELAPRSPSLRSMPSTPVRRARSEPARSIIESLPLRRT